MRIALRRQALPLLTRPRMPYPLQDLVDETVAAAAEREVLPQAWRLHALGSTHRQTVRERKQEAARGCRPQYSPAALAPVCS